MSCSGTLLLFHNEVDAWQQPKVGYANEKDKLSFGQSYDMLQQHYPQAQISHCMLPDQQHRGYTFFINDSSLQKSKTIGIIVDPYQGKLIEPAASRHPMMKSMMDWMAGFHQNFHVGKTGEWILAVFSLIFLVTLLSGFWLYRNHILPVLLFRRSVFRRNNLHQLIGVYALLFNLMFGITGAWMQRYVFKAGFYSASNFQPVRKASPGLTFSMDSALANMQKQYHQFSPAVIYFAQTKTGSTVVYGSNAFNSFIHSKQYADMIMLNPAGQISSTNFVADIDPASRYDIINAQVHYGQYGGLAVKLIYALFGISGALLSITGFISWRRRKKRPFPETL
jgi:uncharacterized iron-regulated membrane protein